MLSLQLPLQRDPALRNRRSLPRRPPLFRRASAECRRRTPSRAHDWTHGFQRIARPIANIARDPSSKYRTREVKALLIEMSTLPIQAPSMRTWETRLPPSSTTAMFMGCLISTAFCSAAAMTLRASSSVTITILCNEQECKRRSKIGLPVSRLPDNNIESMDTACEWLHFDNVSSFRRLRFTRRNTSSRPLTQRNG